MSPLKVAQAALQAYVDKDRNAIEDLLAKDFHFSSPIDNHLTREKYMARCWPNSEQMSNFNYIYPTEDGDRAFVVYEAETTGKKRFRNSEVHTVRDGKLVSTEVYFGWDLPHRAPDNGFIENDGAGHA